VEQLQKNWKSLLAAAQKLRAAPRRSLLSLTRNGKKRLSPAAYDVLRHEGTEHAGSSPLDREKRPGVFVCAGCRLPAVHSAMKFDSGTGWPSFFTTIPGAFGTRRRFQADLPAHRVPLRAPAAGTWPYIRRRPGADRLRYCNRPRVALAFIPKAG